MQKKLTCIECPKGCALIAEFEQGRLLRLAGNECPKGEKYARQELENPQRTLSTTVRAEGLALARVPVRTDRPIPKHRLQEAMAAIRTLVLRAPVTAGETLQENWLGLGVRLLATRSVERQPAEPDPN